MSVGVMKDYKRRDLHASHTREVISYIVNLSHFYSYRLIVAASGVLSAQSDRGFFHYLRAVFSVQLKNKVVLTLVKTTTLRMILNLDGVPIISKSHTHPSHSETSRLLTSSLSLGVPVTRQPSVCETSRFPIFRFSLSSYWHLFVGHVFNSHFIDS